MPKKPPKHQPKPPNPPKPIKHSDDEKDCSCAFLDEEICVEVTQVYTVANVLWGARAGQNVVCGNICGPCMPVPG